MRFPTFLWIAIMAPSFLTAQILSVPSQYGTIAAAIAAAMPGQIVEIAPGTYFEHDLDFAGKAITVRGVGPAAGVVVDAQSAGRGFQFHSGEGPTSILEGVTIRNGVANESAAPALSPHGGGILCLNSAPVIRGCRILNCRAQDDLENGGSSGSGGGIAVTGGAARIENCLVQACRAGGGNFCLCSFPDPGHGGGIWINASGVVVSGSTIRSCIYPAGGIDPITSEPLATGNGCGIYARGSGLTIEDCMIESNGFGSGSGGRRGDGAGLNFLGTGQIRRTRFFGNGVLPTGCGGGAFVGSSLGGVILFEDCRFEANTTYPGFAPFEGEPNRGGDGAGLYVSSLSAGGSLILRGCDFIGNQCGNDLAPTPESGNGGGSGGGAYVEAVDPGNLVISGCRFIGNRAGNGVPGVANDFDDNLSLGGWGGALFIEPSTTGPVIENCEFIGNRAGDGALSTVPSFPFTLAGLGGAIYVGHNASIRFCSFVDNFSGSTLGFVQPYSAVVAGASGNSTSNDFIVGSIIRGSAPSHVPSLVSVSHSNIEGGFFGVGNIDVDPKFVDRVRGNLHLAAGSPMIGAVPVGIGGTVMIDVDGESRPSGAPRDMGADQFLRMGTADDIELRTRIANRGRGTNAVITPLVGESLTLTIDSPGGTFDGLPVVVAAQGFSTAAPLTPNPSYDFIHLSGSTAALLLIEPALAPAGFTTSATTPAGLGGFVTRIQAFVAAPNVQNGIIATTAAHDIVWP